MVNPIITSIVLFWFFARLAVSQPEFQQRRKFSCLFFVSRSAARQLIRFCRQREEAVCQFSLQCLRSLLGLRQRQRTVKVSSCQRENDLRMRAARKRERRRAAHG